jgi:hypothetical protein
MNPTTVTINGEQVTIAKARVLLGVPDGWCFGCYLGDDGCATHDLCPSGEMDYVPEGDTP